MSSSSLRTQRISMALWIAVVIAVIINLRPFLTAVGPLGNAIQQTTGMSLRTLSWLTLLPMALMGVGGAWAAPAALQRMGARAATTLSLALIALGCALRLAGGSTAVLLLTAALCGIGVALIQGILPGVIKRQSPSHVAPMMGLYSAALMGGGALGAQVSPLAMQWGMDWRPAIALWAVPALIAMPLAWHALGIVCAGDTPAKTARQKKDGYIAWLARRPRTWTLILCFGLINGGYASVVAWLAPYYQAHGWSTASSGTLVAILAIAQAAAALGIPVIAARNPDRRLWLGVALALQLVGFAVLAWLPDAMPTLNAILLGAGLGGCFALMMVVALDHLHLPSQAGALNALMQGGGFILASVAPWIVAQLHEATGSFASGWLYQLASVCVVCFLSARFAPARYGEAIAPFADADSGRKADHPPKFKKHEPKKRT